MARKKAAIISLDTLAAAGLKSLLSEYYGVCADIAPIDAELPDCDIYILSPEAVAARPDFFMPRSKRCVVVTAAPVHQSFCRIDPYAGESEIIDRLGELLNAACDAADIQAPELSAREADVLRLIATGHINKEIAAVLGISLNTVLTHRKNITAKLGIKSTSGLTVYAIMNRMI